jgi:large subunit ribosomal protein L25
VAFHPVTSRPLHADFLRLAKDAKVEVFVPVVFVNEAASPGLKKGGVLNVVRHELDLICEADKIPSEIQIDVTGRDVGDSIHISQVALPAGSVSKIDDRDFTIATIVAPSALKKAEGAAAAAEVAAAGAASEAEPEAAAEDEAEGGEEASGEE